MKPDVSIIIACYNKETLINETIASVINQSYQNWELLIIDDYSTDNSVAVIKNQLNDKRITLIENTENKGANFCRNKGIEHSKGEYILFLDADDLLIPKCVEGRVKRASENSEVNLLVFTMGVFYKTIGDDKRTWQPTSKQPIKDFLQHKLPWSILQPLWKRELLVSLKGFDESFNRLQDVELNTRALFHNKTIYKLFVNEPDCFYRIDEERKNFEAHVFLEKWIDSAKKYYDKYFQEAKGLKLEKYLMGTIYHTYLQLLYNFRTKKLNKTQFEYLENKLFACGTNYRLGLKEKVVLYISKLFNLFSFRVPGVNWMLIKIIVL